MLALLVERRYANQSRVCVQSSYSPPKKLNFFMLVSYYYYRTARCVHFQSNEAMVPLGLLRFADCYSRGGMIGVLEGKRVLVRPVLKLNDWNYKGI